MKTPDPLRRRWIILALIFCAFVLSYVDRQILSVLKPAIKAEFALDDRGYALLANVFVACYAACYAGAGWLVDRFGAGRMMLCSLAGWSCACAGAAFTKTFGQMAFFRGALGIAEPLAFPSQLRAVTLWFPARMRATANSVCAAGSTVGAIVAVPLVSWLALRSGWRAAFVVPGAAGLLVALGWKIFYRDPPPGVRAANTGDAGAEKGFAWPRLWRTRSLWGIVLSRFISDPVWYFCLMWLPGYLQEQSGLSLRQIAWCGWIPFLAADLGGIGSSALSDRLVKRGVESLRARKLTLAGAACLAPVCALTPHLPHAFATIAIFCLVGIVCLTWLFNLGVVVAEAFPAANVGSVWGIAGAFGAGGAILFNVFVGEAMMSAGPGKMFAVMAVLHPLAALVLWKMIRREKPVQTPAPAANATP
jgi:ACS family hexuronate transporter-like MFS transporter